MINKIASFSKTTHSSFQRILLMTVLAVIFLFLIPQLIFMSHQLDKIFGLHAFRLNNSVLLITSLVGMFGLLLAAWTIYLQLTRGRGTPAPILPTKNLIVSGPNRYTRNPMALGTMLFYLCLSFVSGSISAVIAVLLTSALLLIYIKQVEEKELQLRFGEAYTLYRHHTPFLIPHFKRKNRNV